MTNLPVYEDLTGSLFVQISASRLQLGRALFIAAYRSDTRNLEALNLSESIRVPLGAETLTIVYTLIASAPPEYVAARFKKVGQLEETDSINILNYIVDILAWP